MDMGPPGAWAARARAAASGARLGPQRLEFKPCARSAAARQVCSPEALAKESDESIIKAADFVASVDANKPLINVRPARLARARRPSPLRAWCGGPRAMPRRRRRLPPQRALYPPPPQAAAGVVWFGIIGAFAYRIGTVGATPPGT